MRSRLSWCHVALLCRVNNAAPSFLHPLRRIRAPPGRCFHYWHSIHRTCIFEPPCARPRSPYELHFFFSLEVFYSFHDFFFCNAFLPSLVFFCHLYIGKKWMVYIMCPKSLVSWSVNREVGLTEGTKILAPSITPETQRSFSRPMQFVLLDCSITSARNEA